MASFDMSSFEDDPNAVEPDTQHNSSEEDDNVVLLASMASFTKEIAIPKRFPRSFHLSMKPFKKRLKKLAFGWKGAGATRNKRPGDADVGKSNTFQHRSMSAECTDSDVPYDCSSSREENDAVQERSKRACDCEGSLTANKRFRRNGPEIDNTRRFSTGLLLSIDSSCDHCELSSHASV